MKKTIILSLFVMLCISFTNAQCYSCYPYPDKPLNIPSNWDKKMHIWDIKSFNEIVPMASVPKFKSADGTMVRALRYTFYTSNRNHNKLKLEFGGASSSVWLKKVFISNPYGNMLVRAHTGPNNISGMEIEINLGDYQGPAYTVEVQIPDLNYGSGHLFWINAWYIGD